jgi:ribokinase
MKILNFGSINKDFFYSVNDFVRPGETISSNTYEIKIGGKGLNQSVAISKAGIKVYHAGIINEDDTFIIDQLKSWKINCDNILLSNNPTGHAIIQVNKKGENSIIIHGGANHDFNLKSILSILSKFESGDILLLQNEINNIEEIIDRAYHKKMRIIFNPAPFNKKILSFDLNKINTLILNQSEGEGLSNKRNSKEILKNLNNNFKNTEIILTLGENGSLYSFRDELIEIRAHNVKTIDTTGAGDTFIGYYVAGIASKMNKKDNLERASMAAAITTTKLGGAESIPRIN